jgi:pyridoxal phosphate enzyme (YggS family)
MVELIDELSAQRIAANLERIEAEIGQARGRSSNAAHGEVRILAATKYVADENLPILHEAGVRLVGENRAQDLARKAAEHGAMFEWHFIGQLQSRRVRAILPLVALIHSVASESALAEIERHRELAAPGAGILIEVNVSGEQGKAGVLPTALAGYIERSALPVRGLMTMPPFSTEPERSRPWFASLRELAQAHGLAELSMGTSQDYLVAVEEGATIVRIGTNLYH